MSDAPERTPGVVELNAPSWVNAAADDAVLEWVAIPKEDLAALEQERDEHIQLKEDWIGRCSKVTDDCERLRAAIRDALSDVEAGDFGGAANVLDRALTKPEGECRCDIAGTDLCPLHSPSLYRAKPEGEE